MPKPRTALLLALLAGAMTLAACGGGDDGGESGSEPAAAACNIDGKQRDLGASYVTSLEATGVECAQAEKIVREYHACRLAQGPEGVCAKPVSGFSCEEGEKEGVPDIQFNATMTCTSGDQRVVSTYTQNL
jgi:hypothetical protein